LFLIFSHLSSLQNSLSKNCFRGYNNKMKDIAHSKPSMTEAEAQAAADVVKSGNLAYGLECRAFEEELAQALGRQHALVMASGHAALEIYLESLNLPKESPVALPSYVCAALRHSLHRSSLKPLIQDVEKESLGLASIPADASASLVANMFAVPAPAMSQNGFVLEDCAMGFVPGKTGNRSHAALLSFYATKMLTTGQGGALVTDDENLAEEWRSLLKYDNQENYRAVGNRQLTDIQAAIGRVQLKRYGEFLDKRRILLGQYLQGLEERNLKVHPMVARAADQVLFRLPLQVEAKDQEPLIKHLGLQGIEAKKPVWRPLHRELGKSDADYPVSSDADATIISLPFYPTLSQEELQRVLEGLSSYFST
jgi:perosamine synthetase